MWLNYMLVLGTSETCHLTYVLHISTITFPSVYINTLSVNVIVNSGAATWICTVSMHFLVL